MLRIVLPRVAGPIAGVHRAVPAIADVGVAVEIVVHIDIDVVVSPSAAIAPATAPHGTHGNANPE
jgi:hypothetical protein